MMIHLAIGLWAHKIPIETIYSVIYVDSFSCPSVDFKRNSAFVLFVFMLSSVTENRVFFFYIFCSFDDGVQIMRWMTSMLDAVFHVNLDESVLFRPWESCVAVIMVTYCIACQVVLTQFSKLAVAIIFSLSLTMCLDHEVVYGNAMLVRHKVNTVRIHTVCSCVTWPHAICAQMQKFPILFCSNTVFLHFYQKKKAKPLCGLELFSNIKVCTNVKWHGEWAGGREKKRGNNRLE